MEHEIGGKAEDTDEEAGQNDEDGDVVEGEAEEPIEVPRPDPARNTPSAGYRRVPV
jgi:hypothetical protein